MLKCNDCGNSKEFTQECSLKETRLIDNQGDYIEALEHYDFTNYSEPKCAECGSEEVTEEEVENENNNQTA